MEKLWKFKEMSRSRGYLGTFKRSVKRENEKPPLRGKVGEERVGEGGF